MAKLRDLFSADEVAGAWNRNKPSMAKAAKELSKIGEVSVSPQLMRYWVSQLDDSEIDTPHSHLQELQRSRNAMSSNNTLRRDLRAALDSLEYYQNLEVSLGEVIKKCRSIKFPEPEAQKYPGPEMHIELLFSDLQIGKLSPTYNSELAARRVDEYTHSAITKIHQHKIMGYNVSKITLAIIGDIIESDKKHVNSARACDIGTGDQLKQAIELLIYSLILPLANLGIELDVVMVTGNHDHDGRGMNSYMPGMEHLSWPLFHAVRLVVEQAGAKHVKFIIPAGCFHLHQIFGSNVLYEHGVGVAASAGSMEKRRDQRAQQLGVHISMFRMG